MKTALFIFAVIITGVLSAVAAESRVPAHPCCAQHAAADASPAPPALTGQSLYQLNSSWTNDYGQTVKLTSLRGRPRIVAMFFARCAYACPLLVGQMKQIEEALPEPLRNQVGFVLVSFDTERDTPGALHQYRLQNQLKDERWSLLRGSPDDVLELGALLNVKFKKDAQGQFVHSNVITLLNGEGEIVQQQFGLTADHQELVRQALTLAKK